MSKYYRVSEKNGIFRISNYSWDKIQNILNKSDNELNDFIMELYNDSFFMESIFIASESLYYESVKLFEGKIKKEKKINEIKVALLEYYLRMCSRTTPFGLFSGIAFSSRTASRQKEIKKHLWIDYAWCWEFSKKLEKEYLDVISFQINGFVYELNGNWYLPYTVGNDAPQRLHKSGISDMILRYCNTGKTYNELCNEICETQKIVEEKEIIETISALLNSGFLVSSLAPNPNCKDYLGQIIKVLGDDFQKSSYGIIIEKIKKRIKEYESDNESGIKKLCEIVRLLKSLTLSERYLQIDLSYNEVRNPLEKDDYESIGKAINFLFDFFSKLYVSNTIYNEYKDEFLDKYGDYRCAPLIEMLDENVGIGVPMSYKEYNEKRKGNKKYKTQYNLNLKRYVLERIHWALLNRDVLMIDEEFLNVLSSIPESSSFFPDNVFLGVILQSGSQGKKQFILNSDLGVSGGNMLPLQRFSALFQNNAGAAYSSSMDIDEKHCQLRYIPSRLKWANVMREKPQKCNHINGFLWDNNIKNRVKLEDIDAYLDNDIFKLKNRTDNSRISFYCDNMYSFYSDSSIIRFIKEVGKDGFVQVSNAIIEEYYSFYIHLPEIRIDRVVLYPESWRFNESNFWDLPNNFSEFEKRITEIIVKYDIPDIVFSNIGDFSILINLSQEYGKRILFKSWKKYHQITLLKYDGQPYGSIFANEKLYRTELVMSAINTNKSTTLSGGNDNCYYVDDSKRLCTPGSDWLFVKIYGVYEENYLIEQKIVPWCKVEISQDKAASFFFLRYKEKTKHLRLRVLKKDNYELVFDLISWLESLVDEKLIKYYEIATYEKEFERYGGEQGLQKAETVFYYDSLIAACFLSDSFQEKQAGFIVLAMSYIEEMYPILSEQLDWITAYSPDRKKYSYVKKKYQYIIGHSYVFFNEKKIIELKNNLRDKVKEYSMFLDENLIEKKSCLSL